LTVRRKVENCGKETLVKVKETKSRGNTKQKGGKGDLRIGANRRKREPAPWNQATPTTEVKPRQRGERDFSGFGGSGGRMSSRILRKVIKLIIIVG